MEAAFHLKKVIDDETMFHILVSNLDHDTLAAIGDIDDLTPGAKYRTLREMLQDEFTLSKFDRAAALLNL